MMDRVKGSLFDMLEAMGAVEGSRVLDLFAGTGALGIEALSRGAVWADFVDRSRACCRVIRENLAHTSFSERGRVHHHRAQDVLVNPALLRQQGVSQTPRYDIILVTPPYAFPNTVPFLQELSNSTLPEGQAVVVVEHPKQLALPSSFDSLSLIKHRRYGETLLSIYRNEN